MSFWMPLNRLKMIARWPPSTGRRTKTWYHLRRLLRNVNNRLHNHSETGFRIQFSVERFDHIPKNVLCFRDHTVVEPFVDGKWNWTDRFTILMQYTRNWGYVVIQSRKCSIKNRKLTKYFHFFLCYLCTSTDWHRKQQLHRMPAILNQVPDQEVLLFQTFQRGRLVYFVPFCSSFVYRS